VGAALFVRLQRMGSQKWLYLDVVAYAFPTSWFFGRTGCFLAYDHPGSATNILLAQRYSDGVVRHNLGLDEALYTLPVALLFLWLGRRGPRAPGFFVGCWPCSMRRCAFCSTFCALQTSATFASRPASMEPSPSSSWAC
jgi:phosphatidylglycerol:prolipoprotein diacylglycerol transferase